MNLDTFFENTKKPDNKDFTKDIDKNINLLKDRLVGCDDVIFKNFTLPAKDAKKVQAVLICLDGMSSDDDISFKILSPLLTYHSLDDIMLDNEKDVIEEIFNNAINTRSISKVVDSEKLINGIISGETAILIDGYDTALQITTRAWQRRGIGESSTEAVIRGSKDSFNETFRDNTALLRRRIKSPSLKIRQMIIGKYTKTDIAICYMDGVCNEETVLKVLKRLKEIDKIGISESGYVEQLIEDKNMSIFPQILTTERPETACNQLIAGKVVIVVDNTPHVLIVPGTITNFLKSTDDYNERFLVSTSVRILRLIAIIMSILLPCLYIYIVSYDLNVIHPSLGLYIAGSRIGLHIPAVYEVLFLEFAIDLIREASVKAPSKIGTAVSLVAGLIIGQAIVEAGLISLTVVIIAAITTVANYSIPNYSFALALRLSRFFFIIATALFGMYGLTLCLVFTIFHLCKLNSFGKQYLTPFSVTGAVYTNIKSVVLRKEM